jgi:hypothetical protein
MARKEENGQDDVNSNRGIDERGTRIWRARGAFGTVCCVMSRCSMVITLLTASFLFERVVVVFPPS